MAARAPLPLPSDCPMLRHLSRDTGSQFALMSMLRTIDVVALVGTCQRWSQWLDAPNVLRPRYWAVEPRRFAQLLRCAWVRRALRDLQLLADPPYQDKMLQRSSLESALARLGPKFFPILESLWIRTQVPFITDSVMRDCLQALAPRLRLLDLTVDAALDTDPIHSLGRAPVRSLMQHASLLTNLRVLSLMALTREPESVSFAALPCLPELWRFAFRPHRSNSVAWRATTEQVACLARCNKLIELECGAWDTDPKDSKDVQEATLKSKIAVLTEAKRVRSGEEAAEFSSPTILCLRSTMISPAVWSYLAPLRDLEDLFPLGWTENLSAEQWAQLASFTRLKAFSINPASDWSLWFQAERFLPSLVQCTELQRLRLARTALSVAQFSLLCSSLKKLEWLDFACVRFAIECFALVPSLPCLTFLGLTEYASLTGAVPRVRPLVPALPNITGLRIYEKWAGRLTADAVADDNAALLLRCPRVRPEKLEQNLRS